MYWEVMLSNQTTVPPPLHTTLKRRRGGIARGRREKIIMFDVIEKSTGKKITAIEFLKNHSDWYGGVSEDIDAFWAITSDGKPLICMGGDFVQSWINTEPFSKLYAVEERDC